MKIYVIGIILQVMILLALFYKPITNQPKQKMDWKQLFIDIGMSLLLAFTYLGIIVISIAIYAWRCQPKR